MNEWMNDDRKLTLQTLCTHMAHLGIVVFQYEQ